MSALGLASGRLMWQTSFHTVRTDTLWTLSYSIVLKLIMIVTVHGVDLSPPPETWVPPNCIFEVDDVTKPWTWTEKFDLIHMRYLLGSFTDQQWEQIYQQAYK